MKSRTKLTGGELERECPDQCQDSLRPSDTLDMRPWVKNADDAQFCGHRSHADHVDSTSTEVSTKPR